MKIGYARCSSVTQEYHSQVEALTAAGCSRIYSEKASGKSTNGRPEFQKLMRSLLPGTTVVVCKLCRLARSSRDLHNILHELEEKGCGFVSLDDSWCDTTTPTGRFAIGIMAAVFELEREIIRSRCQSGIDRAREKGVTFGRPHRLGAGEKRKIAERYGSGETMAELAREYECGVATVHRAIHGK